MPIALVRDTNVSSPLGELTDFLSLDETKNWT